MSAQIPIPPPGFDGLSLEEQIEYVEALLNYVTSRPNQVGIPAWHREILEERLARYRPNLNEGTTWEEFEEELIEELKKD
jgi:putative addiction module component (TIGR02574 family)